MKTAKKEMKGLERYLTGIGFDKVKWIPLAIKEVEINGEWISGKLFFDGLQGTCIMSKEAAQIKNFWDVLKFFPEVKKVSFTMITEFGQFHNGVDFGIDEI